jgi:hypothetical protein
MKVRTGAVCCFGRACIRGRSPSRSELFARAHHEQQNGAPHHQAVAYGALGSTHFDVPATQKRAPTKPDNTQTGLIEFR